jgi:hypothetical protein|tara:strand:- start:443 stop:667 length:225 start_codon:yes stop_codon:yes gene_type:complete
MGYSYDSNTDTYHLVEGNRRRGKKKKTSLTKGKEEIINKMVKRHRENKGKTAAQKRAAKIDALERNPNSWKNLS